MKALLILVILMGSSMSAVSQTVSSQTVSDDSFELISHVALFPRSKKEKVQKGRRVEITAETYAKFQFDLVTLKQGCTSYHCVSYGDRLGNNWDILKVHGGAVNRTRMMMIGKLDWTDKITVPYVEPWSELAPGESRTVTFDTSGGGGRSGSHGLSGANADGSTVGVAVLDGESILFPTVPEMDKASAGLSNQVSSQIVSKDGKSRADRYSPVLEAKKGYMYVIRLKDEKVDQYILLRVDELTRGEKVVISYKRLNVPKSIF